MLVAAIVLSATCERNFHVFRNAVEGCCFKRDFAERFVTLPAGGSSFVSVIDNHERIGKLFRRIDVRIFDGGVFALERCGVARGEHDRRDGFCGSVDVCPCGDGLALVAAFSGLHRVNRRVTVDGNVQALGGTFVDGDNGDGIAIGTAEGDGVEVVAFASGFYDTPAGVHELGVVTHGVVFGVDVELCFGAAAPAVARAHADELTVLFAPEEFPGDITVQLAARESDLHNMSQAEHVLLTYCAFHRAEFRHDDGLVVAAVALGDGAHRFAEVFRVQVVRARVVVAVASVVQVVGLAVEILVVEGLGVFFKIVVADAERFGTDDFRRICKRADGVTHGLEGLLVACDFARFGGVEERFFVIRFHVGFVLQADVIGGDTHLFVGLQRRFPPVGEFAIDELSVRVAA